MCNIRTINRSFFLLTGVTLFMAVVFSSCGDTRKLTYMQGKFDTARLSQVKVADPVVQKGDLLSIIVYSDNPAATALYNQPIVGVGGGSGESASGGGGGGANSSTGGSGSLAGVQASAAAAPSTPGYLVDEQGNIQFQGLGVLHVEGLTRGQLRELLDSRLKEFLNHPYYNIRFMNFKFTMLGEVNHPGIFTLPGEQINLLEALGLAGDMTFYGRRDNVLVIRQKEGKREFARLDLTKPEVMVSPYFYLQQNDVVIFEATKRKVYASDQVTTRNVSIAVSIVSTLAIIYSVLRK